MVSWWAQLGVLVSWRAQLRDHVSYRRILNCLCWTGMKLLIEPRWSAVVQTEAERRRREAGRVKQSMEIRLGSCMYVGGYVWYLEFSREPK